MGNFPTSSWVTSLQVHGIATSTEKIASAIRRNQPSFNFRSKFCCHIIASKGYTLSCIWKQHRKLHNQNLSWCVWCTQHALLFISRKGTKVLSGQVGFCRTVETLGLSVYLKPQWNHFCASWVKFPNCFSFYSNFAYCFRSLPAPNAAGKFLVLACMWNVEPSLKFVRIFCVWEMYIPSASLAYEMWRLGWQSVWARISDAMLMEGLLGSRPLPAKPQGVCCVCS